MKRVRRFTTRERALIVAAVIAACSAAVAVPARELGQARRYAQEAAEAHAEVEAQAHRIAALRRRTELVGERSRPEPDLVARIESALHAAGLSEEHLQRASASEPSTIRTTNYARQRANVSIVGVTPADSLRFLAAWREAEPLWTPRSLTLEHAPSSRRAAPTEERFTLRIVLENIHLAAPNPPSR